MKLINLHKKWMETGELPWGKDYWWQGGLCSNIPQKYRATFDMFIPNKSEEDLLNKEKLGITFWASGLEENATNEATSYTPLRQTIVLLICAMHGEI